MPNSMLHCTLTCKFNVYLFAIELSYLHIFFIDLYKTTLSSEEENFCRYRGVVFIITGPCSIFVGIGGCCPCSGGSNRRLVAGREEWKQQPMPQ